MRYGEGAAKLEGAGSALRQRLKEYFGFFDKVDKRLRDEMSRVAPALDLAKRADFEGDKKDATQENRKA